MKTIITFGTFDMWHVGHINILRRAKALGDRLVVGVSSDRMNETEKNKKAFYNEYGRFEMVKSCKYVDEVFFEESLSKKIVYINEWDADILVMGDDWAGKFDNMPCEVIYLPRTKNINSSDLREKLVKLSECLSETVADQHFDYGASELKKESMRSILEWIPKNSELVDIGYTKHFDDVYEEKKIIVTPYTLPNDMHYYDKKSKYILIRHVLEHSPFPYLVLKRVYEHLDDDGRLIVVVPAVSDWSDTWENHYTCLSKVGWEHLFKKAGFKIDKCSAGTWTKKGDIELRYCLKH